MKVRQNSLSDQETTLLKYLIFNRGVAAQVNCPKAENSEKARSFAERFPEYKLDEIIQIQRIIAVHHLKLGH